MYKYCVERTDWTTPSTLLVTLNKDPNEPRLFSFQPGQYSAISFKRHGMPSPARCFSIVSSPTDQSKLQFSMRARGRFTTALTKLQPGDEVAVRGPYGGFVFDIVRDQHAILVAGGIGITPFMSMIQYASSLNLSNTITLVYSVQSQADIPFLEQLKELNKANPYFRIIFVVAVGPTDQLADQIVEEGRVNLAILERASQGTFFGKTFFTCGPPPFMNAVLGTLQSQGIPQHSIITEAFSQGPNRQSGKVVSWPQNMYVLGAIGVSLGSLAIMVSDIIKTLPTIPLTNGSLTTLPVSVSGKREQDLTALINTLSAYKASKPQSVAYRTAVKNAKIVAPQSTQQTPSSSPTASSPISTAPVSTPSVPVMKPPVVQQPKCTTSQSGVTTCN